MRNGRTRVRLLTVLAVAGAASPLVGSRVDESHGLDLPPVHESLLRGQSDLRGPRFGDGAAAEIRRRIDAIRREKVRLGSSHWAGEYYSGDGLGVNQYLYLAPTAGFAFEWHGCLGLYDRNWGTVAQHGDTLVLHPVFPNDRRGFRGVPDRFRWVQWGEKTFLLPGDTVAAFCNGLNGEGQAWGWLEHGDLDLPDPPRSLLSEEIRRCLLPRPLEARVTATTVGPLKHGIAGWKYREIVASIDIGQKDGVFEGMKIYVESCGPSGTIEAVQPKTASARFVSSETEKGRRPYPGARVSTRAPWRSDLTE